MIYLGLRKYACKSPPQSFWSKPLRWKTPLLGPDHRNRAQRCFSLYLIPLFYIIQTAFNLGPKMIYVPVGHASFLFLSPCLSTASSVWIRGTHSLQIAWVLLHKICAILMVFSLVTWICHFSFPLGKWLINFIHFVKMQTPKLLVYFSYASFIL